MSLQTGWRTSGNYNPVAQLTASVDRRPNELGIVGWPARSHQDRRVKSVPTCVPKLLSSALILVLIAQAATGEASTWGQEVVFDTGSTVSCRDITTPEFSAAFPHDRLMEAVFEVSSLQRDGRRLGIEYLVQIYSPSRSIQVVDYEPKTYSAAQIDGPIAVEKTREGSASIGVDGGGAFDHIAQISGHATAGSKTVETERYQKLAPQELILASGVMHRGAGVYYKVRSTPQQTIEGGRQFVVQFRVHDGWRGGLLKVACLAREESKRSINPLDTRDNLGAGQFVVAAYVQGDAEAQRTAERYAQWEFELRRTATALRDRIEDESYPHTLDRIGRTLGVVEPKIPKHWLSELIYGDASQLGDFEAHLPNEMRRVAHQWLAAREDLQGLDRVQTASRY